MTRMLVRFLKLTRMLERFGNDPQRMARWILCTCELL